MSKRIDKQIEKMKDLRLPELQAKYAEIVGEQTRAPNKTYLLRRIREALVRKAKGAKSDTPKAEASKTGRRRRKVTTAKRKKEATNESEEPKLKDLSVEELQAKYEEVLGRPTSSSDERYLIWKIRQAQKGAVPIGPVRHGRRREGPAPDYKILPLRMEAEHVEQLDAARERLGLRSRMDLFRQALGSYFREQGEEQTAALFAPPD